MLRTLRSQRGYVAIATLTLALAVGANLVVFSLVKAIWLRPDPVPDASRVVMVLGDDSNSGTTDSFFFGPAGLKQLGDSNAFDEVAGQVPSGAAMASLTPRIVLTDAGHSLETIAVTPDYFGVLRVHIRGRDFTPDDDREGAEPVAIISDRLWRSAFGGRSEAIGELAGAAPVPIRVIGIAPPGFEGARLGEHADLWIARSLVPRVAPVGPSMRPENLGLLAFARLRDGVTATIAERTIGDYLTSIHRPPMSPLRVVPLRQVFGSPESRTIVMREESVLRVVSASAALVWLAGCVTLMALSLVHYERRRGELALRLALGGTRWRLVKQLGAELGCVVGAGGAGAMLLAGWSLRVLPGLRLPGGVDLSRLNLGIDWWVALAASALALVTLLASTISPLLRFTRADLARDLVSTAATSPRGSLRIRRVLLALHVAASMVLLVAAGLFVRTILFGFTEGTGFDVNRTLFVELQIQAPFALSRDEVTQQAALRGDGARHLIQDLRALPGIEAVAVGAAPLGPLPARQMLTPRTIALGNEPREARFVWNQVSANFVDALGIDIEQGRGLTEGDARSQPMPVLLTRSFARQLWPDELPIGKLFTFGPRRVVVGIIPDVAFGSFSLSHSFAMLAPAALDGPVSTQLALVLRTERPDAERESVRRVIAAVFPDAPRVDIADGREIVARDLGRQRLGAWFFSGFGLVALALGVVGVFGLVAYLAESRRREFGVRMALGASSEMLIKHAVSVGLVPVIAGAVAGLATALLLARFVASLLFGVSQFDPITYGAMAGLMIACAVGAGLVAAWRVRRLSPVEALRAD